LNRKELDPGKSPKAAYGARLRSSREERGWNQEQLAERLEYASSHVSAVETARKPPTLRFSRSADLALGTGDLFERLWRELKHGVLLEGFPEYVSYEARATELRVFEIGIVPGLLQTPEYARALAQSAARRGSISSEHAEERVIALAERQAALLRRRPPMVFVVMDESCVRQHVGGPEVMDAQLERLVEFAANPMTVLQVAPFTMGERRAFRLPLNLVTLPDRSVVSYTESLAQGHLDREPTTVLPVLMTYHQLQAAVLSQADSVALINEVRKGIS
jgi:transcriptional regulator with XRE-family HTH domain